MCQGLRDPGSRQGSGRTLESSDSGPGFRESGTQISRLKAGSFVEAGTGIPLNSESPSHGLTFHSPGTVAVGAGSSASGHSARRAALQPGSTQAVVTGVPIQQGFIRACSSRPGTPIRCNSINLPEAPIRQNSLKWYYSTSTSKT